MYKNFRERGIPRLLRLPQGGAVFDFRGAVAVLTVPHRDIPYLLFDGVYLTDKEQGRRAVPVLE